MKLIKELFSVSETIKENSWGESLREIFKDKKL